MKIYLTYILIFILPCKFVCAQITKKPVNDIEVAWTYIEEEQEKARESVLRYYLGYKNKKLKMGDTTMIRNIAHVYVVKDITTINPDEFTFSNNKYYSVLYNITELYKRNLQFELDRAQSPYHIEEKFRLVYLMCINRIQYFMNETNHGKDAEKLNEWAQTLQDEIALKTNDPVPAFRKRNFGHGLSLGMSPGILSNKMNLINNNGINYSFAFEFAIKKCLFSIGNTFGPDKDFKLIKTPDNSTMSRSKYNLAHVDLLCGYTLIDNKNIKLSPIIGIGISELAIWPKNDPDDFIELRDYSLIGGLICDYKLKSIINLTPGFTSWSKENTEIYFKTKLYFSKLDLGSDFNGYIANISFSISLLNYLIAMK